MAWQKKPKNRTLRLQQRVVRSMAVLEAAEEVSLLSRAGGDQSLLVAMPSEANDNFTTTLGNVSKIVKQSFIALFICAVTDLSAGFFMAHWSEFLVTFPGLIILIPGIIDMRGNIFGSFGARLGTGFHTGEISPTLRESPTLRQQVAGVAVQVLVLSLILSLVVRGYGLATGLETLDIYDLILISIFSGLISGGILLTFTLLLIVLSFKTGWDPDNISTPLITAAGDLITVPILFFSAILVTNLGGMITKTATHLIIMFTVAATVWSLGGEQMIMRKIVLQSLPVLVICGLLSTMAGVFMGENVGFLIAFPALLLLIPAFNCEGGNLGGILSSQITSAHHLGLIHVGWRPDPSIWPNFGSTFLLSVVIFPTLGILTCILSSASGMTSMGFGQIIFISLASGLFVSPLDVLVTYYLTHFFVKIGVDPDNVTIPVITSVMDVLGTASLIMVTMAVVSA